MALTFIFRPGAWFGSREAPVREKTTLAEILSGLRQPHRGVVQLGGRRLGDMESPRVALIGETFQAPDGRIMDILGGFEARKDSIARPPRN